MKFNSVSRCCRSGRRVRRSPDSINLVALAYCLQAGGLAARFPLRPSLCLALVSLYVGTMKLSDNQIGDRLHAAMKLLEPQECETVAGRTAMEAARRALWLYGSALIQAGEHKRMREEDHDV
jgi:hypothetical protein